MERDDLIVNDSYALNAHHSEEEGAAIRKNVWKVTAILTFLTTAEVFMGIYFKRAETFTWSMIKWTFVILTLVKAAYIVLVFMHLGDERPNLKKSCFGTVHAIHWILTLHSHLGRIWPFEQLHPVSLISISM